MRRLLASNKAINAVLWNIALLATFLFDFYNAWYHHSKIHELVRASVGSILICEVAYLALYFADLQAGKREKKLAKVDYILFGELFLVLGLEFAVFIFLMRLSW